MSKIKDGNYIVIQSFMVKDLHLKGNELLIYAIIYGFTQDGEHQFNGGQQYLAEWTNSTKTGVYKALKRLVEKGLIERIDGSINGVNFVNYRLTKLMGVLNKVNEGVLNKVNPNNIDIDNKIDNKDIYGEFKNVLLTKDEYAKLKEKGLLEYIEDLSIYIDKIGIAAANKKYKSHYSTILSWSRKDRSEKKIGRLKSNPNFDIADLKEKAALNDNFDI